ncbi:monocarboxylate transporter 6-like [Paramacrobiotus metropolitanus]|uniref:monocarboxylate transporter 6-like n=1 Tax=Paramacrobiotus metropolitanus TaxID=2943436 RepID=UPI002446274E|nr:monocarboxylate transporter 6-like [Paramacrobiotus metropolitanus]
MESEDDPRDAQPKRRRRNVDEDDVDEGWAWVVLVASFIVNIISLGTNFSLGVYFAEFVDYFKESKTQTAFLISLSCALVLAAGPFASVLANRFGTRILIICGGLVTATGFILSAFVQQFWVMFITFGFMTGFGGGLSYSPSFGVLPLYFRRRRNFATAIVTAGNGVGIFIFPFLFRYLIATYSWRGAMFINAGIALNVIPCGAVIFKRQKRIPGGGLAQFLDLSLFREASFYYHLLHFYLMGSNFIFTVLCIRYALDVTDATKDQAPLLLTINGAMNIVGRTLSAVVSTNPKIATSRNRFILLHIFSISVAVSIASYGWCTSFPAVCVVAGWVGLSWGTKFALVPGVTIDIVGADRFNAAWGYSVFILGLAFLSFPPLGSYIADSTLSFSNAFYFSGIVSGVAALFCFLLHFIMWRKMQKVRRETAEVDHTVRIVRYKANNNGEA